MVSESSGGNTLPLRPSDLTRGRTTEIIEISTTDDYSSIDNITLVGESEETALVGYGEFLVSFFIYFGI